MLAPFLAFFAGLPPAQAAASAVALAYAVYRIAKFTYRRVLTLMCMSPIPYGSRLTAPLIRSYSFTGKEYFNSDGCSEEIAARREKGANVRRPGVPGAARAFCFFGGLGSDLFARGACSRRCSRRASTR